MEASTFLRRLAVAGLLVSVCTLAQAGAVPETSECPLSGGVTVLAYNDLSNNPVPGSAAVLLGQPVPFKAAEQACHRLTESLWVPTTEAFLGGLNSSLSNQLYEGLYADTQMFWVASQTSTKLGDTCHAMDVNGTLHTMSCSDALPILCSQTAPVSTWNMRNTSTAFQVSHRVGRQTLTGYRDHYAWKFLGIRYAPPTARFDYSTVLDDVGTHTAIDFGAPCLQPEGQITPGTGSDDCLFLSIWTPTLPPQIPSPSRASKPKLKPVAFYIYGGGLTTGDSADPNTDGTNLASRGDVVVVAPNYRLGNLGLLSVPQSGSSKHNGNYGLGDQITALQWVQRNIASFGGDPARVTIFGESAGAESVHALLSSPAANGLFINAIMQSDPQGSFSGAKSLVLSPQESYEKFTRAVLNQTGCAIAADALACLKAYDGEKLAAIPNPASVFTVDGHFLTSPILALNNTDPSANYTADVAVITGSNRDESAIMIPLYPQPNQTLAEYLLALVTVLGLGSSSDTSSSGGGLDLTALLSTGLFPIPPNPLPADIFAFATRLMTDFIFRCAENALELTAARHHPFASLHTYVFNRTYSPTNYTSAPCSAPPSAAHPYGDPSQEYLKCHGGEQVLVFGSMVRAGLPPRDADDLPFSQLIVDYWSAFFWTRDPNPAPEALAAKGYGSTLAQTARTGPWLAANASVPGYRLLQWDGGFLPMFEVEQCAVLGQPGTMFEPAS